jgi:hypothetical protein
VVFPWVEPNRGPRGSLAAVANDPWRGIIRQMPANRVVPLVAREVLGGAHFLLTFRHPEAGREARPGQFVMIKAGVSAEPPLRRPSPCS